MSSIFSLHSGKLMIFTISAFSRLTMSRGVAAGASPLVHIDAVYLQHLQTAARVRAFVDFVLQAFALVTPKP